MLRVFMGIFIALHGLVHMWYVVLSRRLVEYKPEMGWSGRSWLFTGLLGDESTRALASLLYALAALVFLAGGAGLIAGGAWWRPVTIVAAVGSSAIILLFWDGRLSLLVQKGLVGLAVNIAILVALLVFNWPTVTT